MSVLSLPLSRHINYLYLALTGPPIQKNILTKKTSKVPRVFDKSKAMVITEKFCYIACINTRYGNPSLDSSRPDLPCLDCLTAGRPLPCGLCLSRCGGSITFPSSPLPEGSPMLPDFTPRTDAAIRELPLQKKDKLTKAERVVAENHFLDFGESVRQHESNSNNHNVYCPQSSYFPSHILSSILDQLLVIHFPSQLEDIVNNSWIHYSSHGTALFDSIIMIQVQILAQRSSKQKTANAKQRDTRRRQTADSNEDEDNCRLPSPDAVPELEEQVNQSPTRKCIAINDITNTTKRPRAPRAPQPSVAQAFEGFGPQYRTRRRVITTDSEPSSGKENEAQPTRSSLRLRRP